MSRTAYAEGKRRAAEAILGHRHVGLVANLEPVKKAARGEADRDVMFSLSMGSMGDRATIDIGHDYDGVPPSCQDEAGNTVQACRLRATVSFRGADKVTPMNAYFMARFYVQVGELADAINALFVELDVVWEVIVPVREEAA